MVSLTTTALAVVLAYVLGLASIGVIVNYSEYVLINRETGEVIGNKNIMREAREDK